MTIKTEMDALLKRKDLVKEELRNINQAILDLQERCSHEDLAVDKWRDTATCNDCNKYFSWYCPTSPSLECDYEQEDGSYNDEYCRYCGNPEERK